MKKINWKVRFRNPLFLGQLVAAIAVPVLAYMGITVQDLTTWGKVGEIIVEAVTNPYILGLVVVSVFNAISDPTTKGITDSEQVLSYQTPKK